MGKPERPDIEHRDDERRKVAVDAKKRLAEAQAATAANAIAPLRAATERLAIQQEIYNGNDIWTARQIALESGDINEIINIFEIDPSAVTLPPKDRNKLWRIAVAEAERINQERETAAKLTQAELQKKYDEEYSAELKRAEQQLRAFEEAAAKKKEAGVSAIDDFFQPEKNSIVRSFRSAGGKGLAGFIESMNFEWLDNQNITWETEKHKAPMLCKVTVQFSPVHDISPGLDSQGYNRAPVYPVGHFEHSREELDQGPED